MALHKDMVYSFCYYYLGTRQEAEDATQEVLIKFWRHWRELSEDAMPRWLNRVTRNHCYDLLRRRTRQQKAVSNDGENTLERVAEDESPSPHSRAETTSLGGAVRAAVARLPEPYRSAVVLREIQEHTYVQVGEVLDLPVNTVKTHVHRGRRMLRESLKEQFVS